MHIFNPKVTPRKLDPPGLPPA